MKYDYKHFKFCVKYFGIYKAIKLFSHWYIGLGLIYLHYQPKITHKNIMIKYKKFMFDHNWFWSLNHPITAVKLKYYELKLNRLKQKHNKLKEENNV